MREYSEEWAAAIDILGYCRLAILDTTAGDALMLELQEIALATLSCRPITEKNLGHRRVRVTS